jgi:hypothetical protein
MADIHSQQGKQVGNGAAKVVRRGEAATRATAEVARHGAEVVEQAGARAQETQRTTRSAWEASQDMLRMLQGQGQGTTSGSLPEMSQAFAELLGEMCRTNLKIGQELFRLANPMALIEMQQKFVRSYLDAIAAGQSLMLGTAQRTTEDAQRQPD